MSDLVVFESPCNKWVKILALKIKFIWTVSDVYLERVELYLRINVLSMEYFILQIFPFFSTCHLSTLQNKTNNFLKRWRWSKECFQDHIFGAGLLNFVRNLPLVPQTLLNTDLLDDCMEECWKTDTECLHNAFIYAYSC